MNEDALFTDREIEMLISCPKEFRMRPREMKKVNKNYQQRFSVFSLDTGEEFTVFIAYSQIQELDFSIGLKFGDNLLFRVNGFHGTTRAGYFHAPHHASPHTHTLTHADLCRGNRDKPSSIADMSGQYVDLPTARLYFFKRCGIIGFEQYYEVNQQLSMFDSE